MDDTLEAAQIPVGHGPGRWGRHGPSGRLGRAEAILPFLVQVEAQLVALDDRSLEVGLLERAPDLAATDDVAVPLWHLLAEPPDVGFDAAALFLRYLLADRVRHFRISHDGVSPWCSPGTSRKPLLRR